MKFLITSAILFLCLFPAYGHEYAPTFDDLLDAIEKVESNQNANAVGDNGKAIGSFQIWKIYWQDAVEFDKNLDGKYKDCYNRLYARQIVMAYMRRYAMKHIKSGNWEAIARIHNGGPAGYYKKATLKYWNKVKKELYKDN